MVKISLMTFGALLSTLKSLLSISRINSCRPALAGAIQSDVSVSLDLFQKMPVELIIGQRCYAAQSMTTPFMVNAR
jgi:hypothetical protein